MKYCEPDLQSRQQLQKINLTINELRNQLLENARLDVPLLSNHHFYAAMESLLTAGSEIGQLRAAASPLFLSDLESGKREEGV